MKHALVPMTDEIAASPNGGKVSREQFNAAWLALEKSQPYRSIRYLHADARAVIEALGLEVEE